MNSPNSNIKLIYIYIFIQVENKYSTSPTEDGDKRSIGMLNVVDDADGLVWFDCLMMTKTLLVLLHIIITTKYDMTIWEAVS
jgi:hypothetical protein